MTQHTFTLTDDECRSFLKVSRDILGEPAQYMSGYDENRARDIVKQEMWEALRAQLGETPHALRLSDPEIRDVLRDIRRYGHVIKQENATRIDRHHVSRVVAGFSRHGVDVKDTDVFLRNEPLLSAPQTKPHFWMLQDVDKGPFIRMVYLLLGDDSVTDGLRLSRQDVHTARRDILGAFVDAKHGYTCQVIPVAEPSLRLLLDAVTYATSLAILDASYATYTDPDFVRFRDDLHYTVSKKNRPGADDDTNEE